MLIATGRNSPEAIDALLRGGRASTGSRPRSTRRAALAAGDGRPGPAGHVILDREGDEIARLIGGADWNGPSARAIVADLLAR